jgi:hypothetical protein
MQPSKIKVLNASQAYSIQKYKETFKANTVATDGAPKKTVIIDATGCNPQIVGLMVLEASQPKPATVFEPNLALVNQAKTLCHC